MIHHNIECKSFKITIYKILATCCLSQCLFLGRFESHASILSMTTVLSYCWWWHRDDAIQYYIFILTSRVLEWFLLDTKTYTLLCRCVLWQPVPHIHYLSMFYKSPLDILISVIYMHCIFCPIYIKHNHYFKKFSTIAKHFYRTVMTLVN